MELPHHFAATGKCIGACERCRAFGSHRLYVEKRSGQDYPLCEDCVADLQTTQTDLGGREVADQLGTGLDPHE
jgi:hypothetical protein